MYLFLGRLWLIYVFIINEIENICRGSIANTSIIIIYAFAGHLSFVEGLKRFQLQFSQERKGLQIFMHCFIGFGQMQWLPLNYFQ